MALEDAKNPLAGVAGPGKYSVRTDKLQLGSTGYGEGVDTAAINSGAPKATSPDVRAQSLSSMGMAPSQQGPSVGLYDPTQRPNEPVTSGIDRGYGPGSDALMMGKSSVKLSDTLAAMLPFDNTGEIAILYQDALARGN